MNGDNIYSLALKLWSLNSSITGDGVRQTLGILKEFMPDLSITEVPTGTSVF